MAYPGLAPCPFLTGEHGGISQKLSAVFYVIHLLDTQFASFLYSINIYTSRTVLLEIVELDQINQKMVMKSTWIFGNRSA